MEVVSEFRDASLNTTAPAAIQNMIAMYPELDGIVCTGASNGVMEAVIQTLATEGKTGTIKFATLDVQDGTGEYMDEGALDFIGGGQYPEVVFLALCCVNAVDGTIDLPIQIDSQFRAMRTMSSTSMPRVCSPGLLRSWHSLLPASIRTLRSRTSMIPGRATAWRA